MTNPWFRLYNEAIDDEKLRLLAFEDRWHFIALLCCKNLGLLEDNSDLGRRKVAVKLGLDLRELGEVARRLSEVGLIDRETMQPLHWDKRQFKSDNSTERVKNWRKNKEIETCNGDETLQQRCSNAVRIQNTETDNKTLSSSNDERRIPYSDILDAFAKSCPSLPKPQKLTDSRRRAIRTLWARRKEQYPEITDFYIDLFTAAEASDFLTGREGGRWSANFDWLLKEINATKVLEGNYKNRPPNPADVHPINPKWSTKVAL